MVPLNFESETTLLQSLRDNIDSIQKEIGTAFTKEGKNRQSPVHWQFSQRAFIQVAAASAMFLVKQGQKESLTADQAKPTVTTRLVSEGQTLPGVFQAYLNHANVLIQQAATTKRAKEIKLQLYRSLLEDLKKLGYTKKDLETTQAIFTQLIKPDQITTTTTLDFFEGPLPQSVPPKSISFFEALTSHCFARDKEKKDKEEEKNKPATYTEHHRAYYPPASDQTIRQNEDRIRDNPVLHRLYSCYAADEDNNEMRQKFFMPEVTKRITAGLHHAAKITFTLKTRQGIMEHITARAANPVSPHIKSDAINAAVTAYEQLLEMHLQIHHKAQSKSDYALQYIGKWGLRPKAFNVSLLSPGAGCFRLSKLCLPDDNNDRFMNDIAIAAIEEHNKTATVKFALVNTPYNTAGTYISKLNIAAVTKHYDSLIERNQSRISESDSRYDDFNKINALNRLLKKLYTLYRSGKTEIRHLIPVVIQMLTETAGDICHINCKSSKDRWNTYYATLLAVKTIEHQNDENIIQTISDAYASNNDEQQKRSMRQLEEMKQAFHDRATNSIHLARFGQSDPKHVGNNPGNTVTSHKVKTAKADKRITAGVFITLLTASLTCALQFQNQILSSFNSQPENTERDTRLLRGTAVLAPLIISGIIHALFSRYKASTLNHDVKRFQGNARAAPEPGTPPVQVVIVR